MIFIPGISLVINGLIIFFARILRRDFFIQRNSLGIKILSYLIIAAICLISINTFIYIIKASLDNGSNLAYLAAISAELSFTEYSHAADNSLPISIANYAFRENNKACYCSIDANDGSVKPDYPKAVCDSWQSGNNYLLVLPKL